MTISLYWADDIENVLIWQFKAGWTWEAFYEVTPQSNAMIANTSERVDVLMITSSKGIPEGAFAQFDKLASAKLPQNLGLVIIVNPTSAVHTMVKISAKFNAVSRWKLVGSIEDAYSLIETDRNQQNDGDPV